MDDRPNRGAVGASLQVPSSATAASGRIRSSARGLRWTVRSRLAESPALYLPVARAKYRRPGPQAVSRETELVIDGYTRSAVTFAVFAFQMAQDRPVRVAHHLHAPAQLIAAARRGVPALAIIREPEEAILSAMVRESYVTPKAALVSYSRFYEKLLSYRRSLVTAGFDHVTSDLGAVIRRVNLRFGTRFQEFEHTPENVRACFKLVEVRTRRPAWDQVLGAFESGLIGAEELRRTLARHSVDLETPLGAVGVERAARPSPEREELKDALRRQLLGPELRELRARAGRVYQGFVADAES